MLVETIDKFGRMDALSGFPSLPDQTRGQVLADALAAVCADSLTASSEPGQESRAVTVAEVFVDAALAAPTCGAGSPPHRVLGWGPCRISPRRNISSPSTE